MDSHCIRFTEIPHTTALFADTLYSFSKVKRFYGYDPYDPASFSAAAQHVSFDPERRRAVAEVLAEQNQSFDAGPDTHANIARLGEGRALAVVTGQQIGLFGGPAYSVYKALTAIRLAEKLTAEGLPAVPVFWLAGEDHDFAEVNHCAFLDDRHECVALQDAASPPENAPVGQIELEPSIVALRQQLTHLWPAAAAREAETLLAGYTPGATYTQAFGQLFQRLFAGRGLIVLDPLDATLHSLSRLLYRRALEEAESLHALGRGRDRELTQAGYHVQVRLRENATLLFLSVDGQRLPLRRGRNGMFVAGGGQLSLSDLLAELEAAPVRFSGNVLLRPIVQDYLLPTVAYVAGPNELAYFAQVSPLYEKLLGCMPVIFPRVSLTLVDAKVQRLLQKYRLSLPHLFRGPQAVRARLAERHLPPRLARRLANAEAKLGKALEETARELKKLDPTLEGAADTGRRKMLYQFGKLRRKAARAQAERTEIIERHLAVLFNSLYPAHGLQERYLSFLSFVARCGQPLVARLLEQVDFPCRDHQVIFL